MTEIQKQLLHTLLSLSKDHGVGTFFRIGLIADQNNVLPKEVYDNDTNTGHLWEFGQHGKGWLNYTDGAIAICVDTHGLLCRELQSEMSQALTADMVEAEALHSKMVDILNRTAVALKGPEPELTRWSWHDLPEEVEKLKAKLAAAQGGTDCKKPVKTVSFDPMPA